MRRVYAAGIGLVVGLGAATPGLAKVHEQRADGFITRDSVTVAASPLETWLLLTKPGEWWSDEHTWSGSAKNMTLTPQANGCFCERIPAKPNGDAVELEGSVAHGTVIQANPMKLLRIEAGLGPLQSEPARGLLTFAFKDAPGGGTVIQMEYSVGGSMRYKIAEIAPVVDKVLSEQLKRLGAKLGVKAEAPASDPGKPAEPSIEAEIDALGE